MPQKTRNFKVDLKNLAILSSYFDYIFVHRRQKAHLRRELGPKFCQLEARTQPEKPCSTYNSATMR